MLRIMAIIIIIKSNNPILIIITKYSKIHSFIVINLFHTLSHLNLTTVRNSYYYIPAL